jgi:hypothetical protein
LAIMQNLQPRVFKNSLRRRYAKVKPALRSY